MIHGNIDPLVLVYAAMHLWQHQVTRSDMFVRALIEKSTQDASNAWAHDIATTPFAKLGVEQQALLVQAAYQRGFFDAESPHYHTFHYDVAGDGVMVDLTRTMHEVVRFIREPSSRAI